MITFSPIQKLIQETLHQKMRMLDKTPKIGINEPSTEEGGVPHENYMFARSVFLRMTSLLTRKNKPIVLMGGELFEGQYRKGLDVYGLKSGGIDEENPNLRPMAGVKDVNVEYAGGGMKIGATRKTSISWTCWTWEELQKFKPFFLTHGKAVLIEFGWGFQGADSPSMLPIINENGDINQNLITGEAAAPLNPDQNRQTTLQEMIPEYILKQKGHYDAVLGTINNFEFSVNETGGFDCTTELVSMGVNTMRKMDSKESVSGHISNLPILQPEETGMWWWKSKDFLKNQAQDKNPYYSFKSYMKSLEGHLHSNALNSKGSIAYILGGDAPYCTWGWFEDNVLSRFAGQINADNDRVVSEFRSLESVYDDDGNQVDIQPTLMRVSRDLLPLDYSPKGWFWVYPEQVSNRLDFWKDKSLNEKNKNNKLIPEYKVGYTTYSATGGYYGGGMNNSSTTIGDFQLMFAPPYLQQGDSETGKYLGTGKPSISDKWKKTFNVKKWNYNGSHFRPFKNDTSFNGVIRNVYFGHEFLTECFDKSTIAEGIESVWSKFSQAYGGIYDFGIEFDDREGRLMIKDKGFSDKKVHKVLENTSKKPATEVYDNKGVFVFPIWEKTSIVKNQTLNAKLPNRMQVAAMYGNNDSQFGDGVIEDMEDWGAISLGRKNNETEEDENKRQKLFDSLLGSMEHPFRRLGGDQYTFGNASADDTKPLQWKVGNSPHTTNIYEDLTGEDGSANDENDKFGQGINEVMEEDLKIEYNKRLLRAAGLEDDVEDTEQALKDAKIDKEKLQKQKDAFKSATTEAGKVSKIYTGDLVPQVKVNRNPSSGAKMTYYPKMKDEYRGIMRMSLKGTQDGILKTSDPLIPIELEIEIDGTGGIFPGNSFHSSYLPQSYMDRMCFQVIGASHQISSTGWSTTLKGQMRVAGMEKTPPPERIEDVPGFGVLKPEVFEELPEVKEIREQEKKDNDLTRDLMGDLIGDFNEGIDIDPTPKPKPKIKPKKKKEVKKFKKNVKVSRKMEQTSTPGEYRIGGNTLQGDFNEGSVIFVGKLGSDYDAGSRTVNTPSGRKSIDNIQGTAGSTYDATKDVKYQWDNSFFGGDFFNSVYDD